MVKPFMSTLIVIYWVYASNVPLIRAFQSFAYTKYLPVRMGGSNAYFWLDSYSLGITICIL